jgi:hypothetical protein
MGMGFLKLNVYGHPSGAVFDPDRVIQKVKERFPETKVVPGDQLALSAERAAAGGAADQVVATLRRTAQSYGPAYAFEIPIPGGRSIHGRARRYDISLLFDDPLPEELRSRFIEWLKSFGVGKLEASTETSQTEILCDLGRPGDSRDPSTSTTSDDKATGPLAR